MFRVEEGVTALATRQTWGTRMTVRWQDMYVVEALLVYRLLK